MVEQVLVAERLWIEFPRRPLELDEVDDRTLIGQPP